MKGYLKMDYKEKIEKLMEEDLLLKDLADALGFSQQWTIILLKKYNLNYNFKKNIGRNPYWKGKPLPSSMKRKISKTKQEQNKPAHNKLNRVMEVCPICGELYENVPEAINRSLNKKYCSPDCKNKAHSKLLKGKKSNKVFVFCDNCGNEIVKYPSLIRKNNFCSYECFYSYRKGKTFEELYGENKAKEIKESIDISTYNNNKFMPIFTKPHRVLQEAMKEANIYDGFKTSQRISYYEIDEFNPDMKLCIEIDGDYWHANPLFYSKDNLNSTQIKRVKSDKKKNDFLRKNGYNLLRFWEYDIYNNIENCIKQIKEFLC